MLFRSARKGMCDGTRRQVARSAPRLLGVPTPTPTPRPHQATCLLVPSHIPFRAFVHQPPNQAVERTPYRPRSPQTLGVVNTFDCKSKPWSHFVAIEFIAPKMTTRANPKPTSQAGNAVVLRVALQEYKASARAHARARTNASQSVGPQPYRVGAAVASREASVAFPPGLRLKKACNCSARQTRRLTLPSSGLAPAAQAWPSFHSGPSPRRLREPLMSNIRRHK